MKAFTVADKTPINKEITTNKKKVAFPSINPTPAFAAMWKSFINITDIGTYIIENPKYDTNPAIAPVIMLSFIESSDKQLYFTNNQITSGAIKQIKKIKDKIPKYGINVIAPKIAPKNALKIAICLSKIKFMFIRIILAQLSGYGK